MERITDTVRLAHLVKEFYKFTSTKLSHVDLIYLRFLLGQAYLLGKEAELENIVKNIIPLL